MATELQKARTKQVMIEAAKGIVLSRGIAEISVRKVGELAGFSYATIYNYFRDRDHLLWHVTMSFIEDIVRLLEPLIGKESFDDAEIKEVYREYTGYFLSNPRVFELLFFNRLGEPPEDFAEFGAEPRLATRLLERRADRYLSNDRKRVVRLAAILTSAIHGALLIQISGRSGQTREEFVEKIEESLDCILEA